MIFHLLSSPNGYYKDSSEPSHYKNQLKKKLKVTKLFRLYKSLLKWGRIIHFEDISKTY